MSRTAGKARNTTIVFDPSIRRTGWAVFDGATLTSGAETVPASQPDQVRVAAMVRGVVALVAHWAARAGHEQTDVIIETPAGFSYSRSSRGGRALNQADLRKNHWVVGGLMVECAPLGRVVLVDANTWKGTRSKWMDHAAAPAGASHDEADARAILAWWRRTGHQLYPL